MLGVSEGLAGSTWSDERTKGWVRELNTHFEARKVKVKGGTDQFVTDVESDDARFFADGCTKCTSC